MSKDIEMQGKIVTTARKYIKTFICGSKESTFSRKNRKINKWETLIWHPRVADRVKLFVVFYLCFISILCIIWRP